MYNAKNFVPEFFDGTSKTYDKVVVYCTFGKDKYWKEKILGHIKNGDTFLDLACGTGILTRKIAEKFPESSIIGIDITQSYLDVAKKNSSFYKNIAYIHQDAETIELSKKFDYITASYLPKYCDSKKLIESCIKHLKPNGTIIFHDFIYPKNSFVKSLWDSYFMILNFVAYFIPSWKNAFTNLPKLIKLSTWLDSYEEELRKNQFNVKRECLTWNSSAILIAKNLEK